MTTHKLPGRSSKLRLHWLVLPLGLVLGATATWATAETRVGHTVSTTPQRLPKAPTTRAATWVITNSDLAPETVKAKLGTKASVRRIAAGIEVTGVPAGQVAVVAHGLSRSGLQLTEKGRQVRPLALTAAELGRLTALNEAAVAYGLVKNFNQGDATGTGPRVGRSLYPVPQCWKMVCADCGPAPQGGTDCSELERKKDAAYDAYMAAASAQELWQAASQAFKDMAFYGGIAGTIGDMVSAATTVATAGTATAASKAAAKLLIQMARDGVLEAVMADLGIPGLSELTEAVVEERLAAAEAARVAAAKDLEKARKDWVDCMNTPGAMTPAQLQAHKQAVSRYDGCRYRVYMGDAPECELKEIACP